MADPEVTLRGLYAARDAHPGPHPGEDDWVRLASGAMDEGARAAAVDHVIRCAECAAVYRGLVDLEEGARAFDASVPRALGASRLGLGQTARWGTWAAVAAAAAVAFTVLQPRRSATPDGTSDRTAAVPGLALRSAATRPVPVEPMGAVARWPERLRWSAAEGAHAYRVRILDADGEIVWTSPLVASTETAWPAEVAPRPGRMHWQVIALPASGREADAAASVTASLDYAP